MKFSVSPQQYAEFKALTGDTADNIKGADKVGPKTASALLNEFGSLEGIIKRAEDIKKPSVRTSVLKNSERLIRNYKLIKLDNCCELPFSADELAFCDTGKKTTEVLSAIGLR